MEVQSLTLTIDSQVNVERKVPRWILRHTPVAAGIVSLGTLYLQGSVRQHGRPNLIG